MCLEAFGRQYSVFICDLSQREKFMTRGRVEKLMKQSEDSVMIVDLGNLATRRASCFLGRTSGCR